LGLVDGEVAALEHVLEHDEVHGRVIDDEDFEGLLGHWLPRASDGRSMVSTHEPQAPLGAGLGVQHEREAVQGQAQFQVPQGA
jgi:hypothetical protein